jgi:NDP-sugar pyrophosphorylase family protein
MNGDVLTDLDYNKFFNYHIKNKNLFTISSFIREEKTEFGILEVKRNNILAGFKEKPIVQYEVSMGVYVASKKILDYIPADKPFGFDELMHKLVNLKQKVAVKRHYGFWLDIGRTDDYAQAINEFETKKSIFIK